MSDDKDFKPKGEDEIRQEVITNYGFDAEEHKDTIEKITKDKLSQQEALGVAIRQKKDWRQKATDFEKGKDFYKNQKPQPTKVVGENDKEYSGRIEKLELSALGETDKDIIELAKKVAKLENIDLSDVKNSDWFKFQKDKILEQKQIDAATISPEDGSQPGQVLKNYKGIAIEDFSKNNDLGTQEGVEAFEKWKKDNGISK